MNADDLQSLYNSLRGSRSALAVLDAHTLFQEKQMIKAHAKLLDAHTTYQESRTRLLKQDAEQQYDADTKDGERQIRRLQRKQEKAREILEVFDELLTQLAKLARREKAQQASAPAAPTTPPPKQQVPEGEPETPSQPAEPTPEQRVEKPPASFPALPLARPASVSERFLDDFQSHWGDDQLDVISRQFGFTPVASEEDIHPDALYYLRNGDESIMAQTSKEHSEDAVMLINIVNQMPLRPLTRDAFLALGRQRKMVLLLDPAQVQNHSQDESLNRTATTDPADAESAENLDASDADSSDDPQALEVTPEQKFLDMGAFSQLMESAQRCGLVPGADQIGFTRDREFRMGNYDLALQIIEGIFSRFTANAASRKQKLTREDADIASGRMKISPKDLLAKRARDRAQDQAIERARSRFNRVLDGLRVLIKNS